MIEALKESRWIRRYRNMPAGMKATFWFLVCSVLQRGISTITTPIFTRLMTTDQYGQYGNFTSWMSIISIIVTLQLYGGVYAMGIVKFRDEEQIFTSSLQGLTLVMCTAWAVIYFFTRTFWNQLFGLTTVQMLAMFVMIWSSTTFSFWMTTQRNQYKYRAVVALTIAISILKPVIGVFLVMHAEDKVTARILGLMLVELICYSWTFFAQMMKGKVFYSGKYWKYAVLFNIPLLPHYLASRILSSSDRIMIKRLVSDSAAGIYTLAYSVSVLMTMVNEALSNTISPYIYQSIKAKDYGRIGRVVYPALIINAMANLMLISMAPEIIAIFAPKEYMAAIYVIPPVAMSVFYQFIYILIAPFEFYFEKRSWIALSTMISAVINVILNFIFIPLAGYQAAGYTTLVCYMVKTLFHYFALKQISKEHLDNAKPLDDRIMLVINAAFLILGFAYIPLYSNMVLRFAFTGILLLVLFLNRGKIFPVIRDLIKNKPRKQEA